tara:strand:+ start:1272 stop:1787 length:516 start_codon:yes stop_codon:yes gene_type:complete
MTRSIIKIINQDHKVAKLTAIAIALSLIEFFLPSPIPGVKPGIANIIILFTIIKFDFVTAVWVSIIRVFIVSIIVGTFLGPTFFLSLFGSIFSLLFLFIFKGINGKYFSVISLSVIAAFAHIIGQLLIVRFWIIPHDGIFYLLPIFMISALFFGLVNGIVTRSLLDLNINK